MQIFRLTIRSYLPLMPDPLSVLNTKRLHVNIVYAQSADFESDDATCKNYAAAVTGRAAPGLI